MYVCVKSIYLQIQHTKKSGSLIKAHIIKRRKKKIDTTHVKLLFCVNHQCLHNLT